MPPVQANASIAAPGLGLRYIGDYCYAYSGEVVVGTSATDMLSFTTGAGIIMARFQFAFSEGSTADVSPLIALNGIEVFQFSATQQALTEPYSLPYVKLILPPETEVLCTSQVSGGTQAQTLCLVGRVYGTE
jgi:hypothetical protein